MIMSFYQRTRGTDWVQTASFSIGTGTSKFQNAGRVSAFSTRDKVL